MKKTKVVLRCITIGLLLILIGLVSYFSLINKETKIIFNESLKVDRDYQWVLTNMNNQVQEDINDYVTNKNDIVSADKITLTKEESLSYQGSVSLKYPFYTKDKCLYVILALSNNHDIDVALISSNSNAYKFNILKVGETTAKKVCYSDLAKGKYHIYVLDNEEKYDSTQYIVVD